MTYQQRKAAIIKLAQEWAQVDDVLTSHIARIAAGRIRGRGEWTQREARKAVLRWERAARAND